MNGNACQQKRNSEMRRGTAKVAYSGKRHHLTGKRGAASNAWRGGRTISSSGYIHVFTIGHPRADNKGYVPYSVLVAEDALGHYLSKTAIVHHVNLNRQDDRRNNLVVCQDAAYHVLLHTRLRAYLATGDPNKRRCVLCKKWDDPGGDLVRNREIFRHRSCHAAYMHRGR